MVEINMIDINGYEKFCFLRHCLQADNFKDQIMQRDFCKEMSSHSHRLFIKRYLERYAQLWTRVANVANENLVDFLNRNFEAESNLFPFLIDLSEECVSAASKYMNYETNKYYIHDLLVSMNGGHTLQLLQFLSDNLDSFKDIFTNVNNETLLHAVVKNVNCNEGHIQFVKQQLSGDIEQKDKNGFTALHQFYNKFNVPFKCELNEATLNQIIGSLNGNTPAVYEDNRTLLQLVCYREKLYVALGEAFMNQDFFRNFVVLVEGFPDIRKARIPHRETKIVNKPVYNTVRNEVQEKQYDDSVCDFWLDILSENNRSYLMAYMKDAKCFQNKYYKVEQDAFDIIYSDMYTFNHMLDNEMLIIYEEFCKKNIEISELFKFPGAEDFDFYRSPPYLALITGRWDLVMPLIAFSQFDVVPYCLLTCAASDKIQQLECVRENVRRKAKEIHENADAYLAEIVNAIEQKHAVRADSNIVQDYLTKRSSFFNGSLIDIAYFADCKQFFKTSSCETALTNMWKETCYYVSPFRKFVAHTAFHIAFLLLFFAVLLTNGYKEIDYVEIICGFYLLGYYVEKGRRKFCYWKMKCRDCGNNVVDGLDIMVFVYFLGTLISASFVWAGNAKKSPVDLTEEEVRAYHTVNFMIRFFLSLMAITLSIRLLYFFSAIETFGSKLKMIERMISIDLGSCLLIFLVLIVSFGVTFQSLILTDFSNKVAATGRNASLPFTTIFTILTDIVWQPTFTIFVPSYIIDKAAEIRSPVIQSPSTNMCIHILLITFIIMVNVVMMNVVISKTVSDVELTSKESWALHRWKQIRECKESSLLPPPLNIIELICRLLTLSC